jgi:hypothetical protein
MKKILFSSVLLSSFALGAEQSQAVDITIDNFDEGGQTIVESGVGSYTNSIVGNGSNIVGGERDLKLDILSNQFGFGASAKVLAPAPGILAWNNDGGVTSTLNVVWDGVGNPGNGLNLNLSNQTGLLIDLVSVDQTANIEFSLLDINGNSSVLSKSGLTVGTKLFAFPDFTGNASLSQVKSITLKVSGPQAVDVAFNSVRAPESERGETIPEPANVAALGVVAGLAFLKRKRLLSKANP